jgi:hypothetical protein
VRGQDVVTVQAGAQQNLAVRGLRQSDPVECRAPHDPKDPSVAFPYDRCGHLLPEADKQVATKLEAVRAATQFA